MVLNTTKKKRLKAIGHALQPTINIGKSDLTEGVINKILRELEIHELVKIKILNNAAIPVKEAVQEIVKRTGAAAIKVIGFTALLYKRNEDNPVIEF